ncbi:MAG: BlaI/MecI/CopY family transcriptional regulator [Clostridiales bacterium]|jgi:predicted transcriptional regulator|nr:BlaI/MecI/CopY family transcriptional regulator [Clostridiales bacterium]
MEKIKRLPDAEFELMRIVWQNEPPMSTNQIIACLDEGNTWKPQTVLTLLVRLIEKGFLRSEKAGKERIYFPAVTREEYLQAETGSLFDRLHGNSIFSLVNTLYDGKKLSDKEVAELRSWLDERSGGV